MDDQIFHGRVSIFNLGVGWFQTSFYFPVQSRHAVNGHVFFFFFFCVGSFHQLYVSWRWCMQPSTNACRGQQDNLLHWGVDCSWLVRTNWFYLTNRAWLVCNWGLRVMAAVWFPHGWWADIACCCWNGPVCMCNVWKYSCIYWYENDPLHSRSWTCFNWYIN